MKLLRFLRGGGRPRATGASAPELDLDAWRIVRLHNDETREGAVMRVRFSKPERRDIASLQTAIVAKWAYESVNSMPTPEVRAEQAEFERALDPLAPGESSELVHVSTGMGLKEWIFYAASSESFMRRFNELLTGHPAYPVEIELYDDPDWRVWADLVEPLRERTDL